MPDAERRLTAIENERHDQVLLVLEMANEAREQAVGDGNVAIGGTGDLTAPANSSAANRFDLLTVVMHELGHLLGYGHDDGVMEDTLAEGTRRLVDTDITDAVFALWG